jgi:hypothetical protein
MCSDQEGSIHARLENQPVGKRRSNHGRLWIEHLPEQGFHQERGVCLWEFTWPRAVGHFCECLLACKSSRGVSPRPSLCPWLLCHWPTDIDDRLISQQLGSQAKPRRHSNVDVARDLVPEPLKADIEPFLTALKSSYLCGW